MSKLLTLLSFLILTAFTAAIVYGQTSPVEPRSQSVSTTTGLNRSHDFSEITRAVVMDSQGQYVGRITDLVINPDGHVSFAVFSPYGMVGGPAGTQKLVAIPFSALSFKDKHIGLDTTSQKLASAPMFSRNYLMARSWAEDSDRYFGIEPSWREGQASKAQTASEMPMTKGWSRPYEFSELSGTPVKNRQGEDLGKIDDFIFNNEGRISFVVVGYGGFLGIGQKLVAVPVNSLSYAKEPNHFVLNTTKEKIESAPFFSKKSLDDPKFAKDVYRYFGQQSYWTTEEK